MPSLSLKELESKFEAADVENKKQLEQADFFDSLDATIARFGLSPEDLGLEAVAPPEAGRSLQEAVERFRTRLVLETVAKCGGNRTEAARQLDVDPRTIFRYMSRDESGQEA